MVVAILGWEELKSLMWEWVREEGISERESRRFEKGLNTQVKLDIYKQFGKSVEFKKYLHGICDAGNILV